MSFGISVHLPHAEIPMPSDPSQLEAWHAECDKHVLYAEPLGGDGTVYRFWSLIAGELGLPLITAIYQQGLSLQGSEDLARLEVELNQLENYWNAHHLEDPDPKSAIRDHLKKHLQERMAYMRGAITVARRNGAILTVG